MRPWSAMHGQAEDGVPDHLARAHPEADQVGVGPRHRIHPQEHPEEHEPRGQQGEVGQLPDRSAAHAGRVPGREIQHKRHQHDHQRRDGRERRSPRQAAAQRRVQPPAGPRRRRRDQRERQAQRHEQRHDEQQQDRLHRADVEQHPLVHPEERHRGHDQDAQAAGVEGDRAAGRPRPAGPADPAHPGQVQAAGQQHGHEDRDVQGPLGENPGRRQLGRPLVCLPGGTRGKKRCHPATLSPAGLPPGRRRPPPMAEALEVWTTKTPRPAPAAARLVT